MGQSMIKWRKLFLLFLKSAKINHRENVPKDEKWENKKPQKKLFYSNSIADCISATLTDDKISDKEFRLILSEVDKYDQM